MMEVQPLDSLVRHYIDLGNIVNEISDEIERTDILMEMSEIEDILENTANKKYINHKKVREYMW